MEVLAPIPRVSVSTATSVKMGSGRLDSEAEEKVAEAVMATNAGLMQTARSSPSEVRGDQSCLRFRLQRGVSDEPL